MLEFVYVFARLQQELETEQDGHHIHGDGDFLVLSAEQVDDHVTDETDDDAIGNAVCQGHENHAKEGRQSFGVIVKRNLCHRGDHHHADDDEDGGSGSSRNGQEQGRKEQCQRHADSRREGSQSRTSAFVHTGSTLQEGDDGTRSQQTGCRRTDGIGHECLFGTGKLAILHHACLGGNTDERADGVKEVHEQQGADGNHHIDAPQVGKVELEENGSNGRRQVEQSVKGGQTHGDTDKGREEDAPQESATHLVHHDHQREDHTDDCQQGSTGRDVTEGKHGCGIAHHNAGILKSDERDEESDTHGRGIFQRFGDEVDNQGTEVADRQQDENDALQEDRRQGKLPGIAHVEADGVGKEGVQPHARCLRKRKFRPQCHDDGSQDSCQGRRCKHSFFFHSGGAEDFRIDRQDIGHGQESGNAREELCLHGMFLRVETEERSQ